MPLAAGPGGEDRVFTEDDWTDPSTLHGGYHAYVKSKTLAER